MTFRRVIKKILVVLYFSEEHCHIFSAFFCSFGENHQKPGNAFLFCQKMGLFRYSLPLRKGEKWEVPPFEQPFSLDLPHHFVFSKRMA